MAALNGYLALGNIDATGAFVEITGGAYTRQPVTLAADDASVLKNTADIVFPQATGADWPSVSAYGIYDGVTGGTLLMYWAISSAATFAARAGRASRTVSAGRIAIEFPNLPRTTHGSTVVLPGPYSFGPSGLLVGAGVSNALAAIGIPVINRKAANLRRFHTALAKLRTTGFRPMVVFVSDSKGVVGGATPTTGSYVRTDGAEPLNKTAAFAKQLAERGLPVSKNTFFGTKALPTMAAVLAYDARLSGLSGWTGGSQSLGGAMFASGGAPSLTFLAQGNVDTFDVYTKTHAGDGTFTVTADADATVLATINGNLGGEGFKKTSVTVPRGAHAFNVQRTTGGFASLMGGVAKDSTIPAIDIVNAGGFGTVSAYHTSTAGVWNAANAFAILQPALVFVQLGTNDLNTNVPVETYTANIQDLITKAQAAGADVVLEVPTFGAPGAYGTAAQREAYRQALYALGSANGCVVVDHDARFGSYASANALGLFSDGVPHETALGAADEAQALVNAIIF